MASLCSIPSPRQSISQGHTCRHFRSQAGLVVVLEKQRRGLVPRPDRIPARVLEQAHAKPSWQLCSNKAAPAVRSFSIPEPLATNMHLKVKQDSASLPSQALRYKEAALVVFISTPFLVINLPYTKAATHVSTVTCRTVEGHRLLGTLGGQHVQKPIAQGRTTLQTQARRHGHVLSASRRLGFSHHYPWPTTFPIPNTSPNSAHKPLRRSPPLCEAWPAHGHLLRRNLPIDHKPAQPLISLPT